MSFPNKVCDASAEAIGHRWTDICGPQFSATTQNKQSPLLLQCRYLSPHKFPHSSSPKPPLLIAAAAAAATAECLIGCATTEREGSQHFEVDQDKARKALRELDEKLLSLSQQESLSEKRPSPSFPEPTLDRDVITGMRTEEMPEMPTSFFAYTAAGLLFLTIFNNIIFSSFIKPSIDGNEVVTKVERVALEDPSEQQPPQLSAPR